MLRRKNKVLKHKINRFKRKIIYLLNKHKKVIVILSLLLVFLIIIKISYEKYIDNSKNIITKVYFDKKILSNPNYTNLCNNISTIFSWENSVKNKFFWSEKQINLIKNNYKYVKTLKITIINSHSIKINLFFKKPKLTFFWSWFIYDVYSKKNIYTFTLKYLSWTNLLSTWNLLYLPKYLSWLKNVNDIFWKNSPDKIIKYYHKIKMYFKKSKIFYLAWWEDLLVFTDGKKIMFSLSKSIDEQINQLKLLIRKMPDKYNSAKNIDVWNLDHGVYLDVYNNFK